MSFHTAARIAQTATHRCLHQTAVRRAVTNLKMPAMSPTMTEGGISSWKKREGEYFSAGEVLLEIETDKATIDVEAQEDGVMGKILTPNGTKNVIVGRVIALLAEEGDDISSLEVPEEEPKPAPAPKPEAFATTPSVPPASPQTSELAQGPKTHSHHPTHSKHLMPSVTRLLIEGGITNAEIIKGTGVRGMLTKGDVLAHLGRASNPHGTYRLPQREDAAPVRTDPPPEPLDGNAIRRLIISGLAAKLKPAPQVSPTLASFDSIIAEYTPPARGAPLSAAPVAPTSEDNTAAYLDGLF